MKTRILVSLIARTAWLSRTDEKILYVASSDPSKAIWMAYSVNADGTLGAGRVFVDVTDSPERGLPNGLKVDQRGNLWASGPSLVDGQVLNDKKVQSTGPYRRGKAETCIQSILCASISRNKQGSNAGVRTPSATSHVPSNQ